MDIDLLSKNDEEIAKYISDTMKDLMMQEQNPAAVFYALQDAVMKLSEVGKFTTSLKVDFIKDYSVIIETTNDIPSNWSYNIRDGLREICYALSSISWILGGFELKYNQEATVNLWCVHESNKNMGFHI